MEAVSNWIWTPEWLHEDKKSPRIVYFRRAIDLAEVPEKAYVNISADTRYKLYPESVKCASKLSGRTNYSLISWVHPVLGEQEPIGMPHITTEYLRPLQDYPADTRLKVHLTDLSKRPSALCMELYQ